MSGAGPASVRVLPAAGPELEIVARKGSAWAIVWPGMGVSLRSLHRIELDPGGETIALRHPGEAVYCVLSGSGVVLDTDADDARELVTGSMVHVEPETGYALRAGPTGMELIGGPAPADPGLYEPGAKG